MEPPYLQEDLILEILSRLPLKALLRLRSVCKPWLAIIAAPNFPSLHLSRAPSMLLLTNLPRRDLPCMPFYRISNETYSLLDNNPQGPTNLRPLDFPFRHTTHSPHVVTTVNGLVCIAGSIMLGHGYLPIILWNPSIRRHLVLPDPAPIEATQAAIELGYDSTGCDYKVVALRRDLRTQLLVADVYSLNSNTWRRVDIVGPFLGWNPPEFASTGALSRGKIHWLVLGEEAMEPRCLYSFDVVREDFEKVAELPGDKNPSWPGSPRVMADEDDSLYLIESFQMPCSIFRLMGGSNTKYWVELYRVDSVGRPASLVCPLRNGVFVMDTFDNSCGLAIYDPRTRQLKSLETGSRQEDRLVAWVFGNHRESLVLMDREPVGKSWSGSCQVQVERTTQLEEENLIAT